MRNLQARGHPQEKPAGVCRKVTSHGDSGHVHLLPPGQSLQRRSSSRSHRAASARQRDGREQQPSSCSHSLAGKMGHLGSGVTASRGTDHPHLHCPQSPKEQPPGRLRPCLPLNQPWPSTGSHSSSSQMELTKPLTKTIYYPEPLPSLHS